MTLSIRARLTLWSSAVLSLVLAAAAAATYLVYARSRVAAIDEQLSRAEAVVARSMAAELEQGLSLEEAAHDALEDLDVPGRSFAVFDTDGARLAGEWESSGPLREHRSRQRHGATSYEVRVAESLAPLGHELAFLRRALVGGVLSALLLAAAGGWWIARRALGPVALMAAEARGITERTPGFRLSAAGRRDELGVLADAFNDLLGRLERALGEQRQFMADASHELRTPVSVARTAVEVSLARSSRAEAEYRDSLAVVGEQMRRLSGLVEDMFTLARADVAPLPLALERLYLDDLAEDCVRESRVLGAPKGVELVFQSPQDLELRGDERRLRQMLTNLLGNAVRHTPAGGSVTVTLSSQPGAVEISVNDSGGGIPEAERERIFERFVRLDASRRAADGAGLGLPIARMIAEAHGGSLSLARSDASGSTFLVRLPA